MCYGSLFAYLAQNWKILHISKRRVFFKKIIIEQPEKNVSTPTVLYDSLLIFCIGSFRIGALFDHFWPKKNTVFRCTWGRNVCAGFLLRSTEAEKKSWLVEEDNMQGFMLWFSVLVHCFWNTKSSVMFFVVWWNRQSKTTSRIVVRKTRRHFLGFSKELCVWACFSFPVLTVFYAWNFFRVLVCDDSLSHTSSTCICMNQKCLRKPRVLAFFTCSYFWHNVMYRA